MRCGGLATSLSTGTQTATPRPTSLNGQPVVTVDSGTFATVDDSTVRWRPFELADAWGDSPDRDEGWHPYFGVAAEGVVWLGARPYDVATRQFLAPDPLAPLPGRPGSASPYTYAANDPINLFDPTGRSPISIEAFNDIRDRRTGTQWQNIATVAIAAAAVVVTVATLGTAGPVAMVLGGAAIGAVAGAASGAAREGLEAGMNLGDGEFNGETIIRDAVVGGLGGAARRRPRCRRQRLDDEHPVGRHHRRSSPRHTGRLDASPRACPGRPKASSARPTTSRCRRPGAPTAVGTTERSSRTRW